MSRFIEKLKKVGDIGPQRLGFGPAIQRERTPDMLLVGTLSLEGLQKNSSLLEASVDAFLISLGNTSKSSLTSAKDALNTLIWGVQIGPDSSTQTLAQAKKMGGDFIVFDAEGTPSEVLQDEYTGKILTVDLDLDEDTARGIEDLPIDAVVLVLQNDLLPLTVRRLIDLQATRSLLAKSFLLTIPTALGANELTSLRDLGADGLIIDLEKTEAQAVLEMHQAIEKMPRRRPKTDRVGAPLPRAGLGIGAEVSHREDEEEEEEDL